MAALGIAESAPLLNYKMEPSRIRKVVFTFTSAAAETGTTSFNLSGKLLRYASTGGDAAHDFTLNDGDANIFTKAGLSATASSGPLTQVAAAHTDHTSHFGVGIPICGPLTCTMANNSTSGGTITIYWEEM